VGGKTVGVELLSKAARGVKRKLEKGQTLWVEGKRRPGKKEIAFVVEVHKPSGVKLGGAGGVTNTATLAPVKLAAGPPPGYAVNMIAGYGMWPPLDADEVKKKVEEAHKDGAGIMVVDSGLTERWQAYRDSTPYHEIISGAVSEGKKRAVSQAFYFPAFELRREKAPKGKRHKKSLLDLAGGWAQKTLGGKPFFKTRFGKQEFWNKSGDEVLWVCPHSPWRKRFIKTMQQVVRRGARYVFLDVPYLQMAGKHITCRCEHCQRRFKKDTGLKIPRKPGPGKVVHHRWIAWRHQVLRRFFRDVRQAIRKVSKDARLVVEEYPAYIDLATTYTGLDIGLAGDEVDIFAHEYSAKQFDRKPFSRKDRLALAATLGLYRGLDDRRPTWVLSYAHDKKGSRVNAAFHLLMDASFWETKAPEMNDTTVGRRWRRRLFGWFARHQGWFGAARQAASVAVLYSPASRDFSGDHFKTLRKVLLKLTEARVPHRVLSTRDLRRVGEYDTLILPAAKCLNSKQAATLRAAKKTRLLAVGAEPSRGPLCIKKVRHGLKVETATLSGLIRSAGRLPLKVEGGAVVVNLLQRKGELQVRLANLRTRSTRVKVSLNPSGKVVDATVLAMLGKAKKLTLQKTGKTISFRVAVKDLTIVRLRTR